MRKGDEMSDLIRRRDAISRMSDLLIMELQGQRLPTWNEVYQAMNDVPSAESERKWIPVTEALPEEDIDVLLQFPKNMGVGYQEDGFWNIVTGNDMYSGLDEGEAKPIAWMPLPELER